LVYARFVKHRAKAQALIEEGAVRLNRARVEKPAHVVKPDDVLTIALGGTVRVVKVLGAAERRGSASVANQLYVEVGTTSVAAHGGAAEKQDASSGILC
jgi:ribosome-associated heat shock protein Hsp15